MIRPIKWFKEKDGNCYEILEFIADNVCIYRKNNEGVEVRCKKDEYRKNVYVQD